MENKIDYKEWLIKNLDSIVSNKNLMDLIIRITNYSGILNNDEVKYLLLVSLISSDNIVDITSANQSLDTLKFLKNNYNLLDISEDNKKEVLKYVNKGIRICKQDIKYFKDNKN